MKKLMCMAIFLMSGILVIGQPIHQEMDFNHMHPHINSFGVDKGIDSVEINHSTEYYKYLSACNAAIKKMEGLERYKLDSMHMEFWKNDGQTLERENKKIFKYDQDGNLIAYVEKIWRLNSTDDETRYEYSFNSKGLLVQKLRNEFSPLNNEWICKSQTNYKYDDQNFLIKKQTSYYDDATEQLTYSSKNTYQYDDLGNCTEEVYRQYDKENCVWRLYQIINREYNKLGKIAVYLIIERDMGDLNWWLSPFLLEYSGNKTEYTYNYLGHLIEKKFFSWDDLQDHWYHYFTILREYESSDSMYTIVETHYRLEDSLNQLEPEWKTEKIYFDIDHDLLSVCAEYQWNSEEEEWIGWSKEEYMYDSDNNLPINYQYYSWDISTNNWIKGHSIRYEYDSLNNKTKEIYSVGENDTWVNKTLEEWEYNDFNKLKLNRESRWLDEARIWQGKYEKRYHYDTQHNLVQEKNYYYNSDSDQFIASSQKDYIYDYIVPFSNLILPVYIDYYGNNPYVNFFYYPDYFDPAQNNYALVSISDYDIYSSSELVIRNKTTFYYSPEEEFTQTDGWKEDEIVLYPNPFSHAVNLSLTNDGEGILEIYNMQGQLMLNKTVYDAETLHLESLISGIYLYNLYFDGKRYTGKLIKE